jgi:hypothetical protein
LVKALGGGWQTSQLGRLNASADAYVNRTNDPAPAF